MTSIYKNNGSPKQVQLLQKAKQYQVEGYETLYYLTLESATLYYHPEAEFLLRQASPVEQ